MRSPKVYGQSKYAVLKSVRSAKVCGQGKYAVRESVRSAKVKVKGDVPSEIHGKIGKGEGVVCREGEDSDNII